MSQLCTAESLSVVSEAFVNTQLACTEVCLPVSAAIDNMITNHGKGNPELSNLPRKINIGLSTTRDDFAHTHINDVGLYAAKDPETGKVGLLASDVLLLQTTVPCFQEHMPYVQDVD